VRFDWGIQGADAVAGEADVIVAVDVLSFSTTVDLSTTLGVEVSLSLVAVSVTPLLT
jgi:2-phosphosulfolactate phosphatase